MHTTSSTIKRTARVLLALRLCSAGFRLSSSLAEQPNMPRRRPHAAWRADAANRRMQYARWAGHAFKFTWQSD